MQLTNSTQTPKPSAAATRPRKSGRRISLAATAYADQHAGRGLVAEHRVLAEPELREERFAPLEVRQDYAPAAIARFTTFMLPVAHWRVKVNPEIRQPSAVRLSW